MIHAEASTRINRPVAEVFEYATDPTNLPNWHLDVASVVRATPGSVGMGPPVSPACWHLSCVASPLAGTPHSWRIFVGVSKAGEKRLC
jgi:uncharacterized membrane protein